MRTAILLTLATSLALAAAPIRAAAGERADGRAAIRVATPRTEVYVGEAVPVTIELTIDAPWFRDFGVPRTRRRIDVPVEIECPSIGGVRGALERVPAPPASGPARSLALEGVVETARLAAEGANGPAERLEIVRVFVARRAGPVTLGPASLRFTWTSGFDDDLVHGRVPRDRTEVAVVGAPLTLDVRDVPAAGRPAAFGGAVGRFELSASADRTAAAAGEHVKVTLQIRGDGNADAFDPPHLDAASGFHEFGVLDDRGAYVRTVTYELARTDANAAEIPAFELAVFDTAPPAAYRTLRTAPIPLARPGDDGAPPVAATPTTPPAARASDGPTSAVAVAVAVSALLVGVAVFLIRRRAARAPDPADARRRAISSDFARAMAASGTDAADALAAYLAAHLRCEPAAVIAPDLATRLAGSGVAPELAERTARLLERLVAARYGGERGAGDTDAARALVTELDAAFARG